MSQNSRPKAQDVLLLLIQALLTFWDNGFPQLGASASRDSFYLTTQLVACAGG